MKKKITIYTDGACSGNPGKGGWAAVIIEDENEKTISGSEMLTTNNRMELLAVINALKEVSSAETRYLHRLKVCKKWN